MSRIIGLIAALLVMLNHVSVSAHAILIVVNKDVEENALTQQEIRNIFTGVQKTWGNRSRLVLATLKEGPAHEAFTKTHLRRTPRQFDNHWKQQVFTGSAKMPDSFSSEHELLRFVETTPGAIGYVSSLSDVGDAVKKIKLQ